MKPTPPTSMQLAPAEPRERPLARIRDSLREPGPWLLAAAVVVLFRRVLVAGETLFFRDLYAYFLPQKQLLADALASGRLPLVNPLLHGGQPYLASLANGALYPANLVYLALPVVPAFNTVIVAHLVLAACSGYLLARGLGLGQPAATTAGAVTGLAGIPLSLVNVLNLLLAYSWIPAMVLAWHRFILGRGGRWLASVVGIGVIQLLAGAPEVSVLTFATLLVWSLATATSRGNRLKAVGWCVLAASMTLACGAVQILPTLEIVRSSTRADGLSFEALMYWSVPPRRLVELAVPAALGPVDTLRDADYWGRRLVDGGFPYLVSVSFGVAATALLVLGAARCDRPGGVPARLRRALLALAAVAVVAALGRHLPGAETVAALIPGVSMFRYPSKLLIAAVLPAGLLAACGVDSLTREPLGRRQRIAAWAVGGLAAGAALAVAVSPVVADVLLRGLFDVAPDEPARTGIRAVAVRASLVWLVGCGLMTLSARRAKTLRGWLLAMLVVAELMVCGWRLNPSTPPGALREPPPLARLVGAVSGDGRLFRDELPPAVSIRAPANHVVWRYRFNLEVLESDLAATYGIPVVLHEDLVRMAPAELADLRQAVLAADWQDRLPALATAGVTVVVTSDRVDLPGLEPVAAVPNRAGIPLFAYRVSTPEPRVRAVDHVVPVRSLEDAVEKVVDASFDPHREVIVHGLEPGGLPVPAPATVARRTGSPAVRVEMATSDRVEALVHAPAGAVVTSTTPYAPGWSARVDGDPTRVLRANVAYMAVVVPPGTHRVELAYRPAALRTGAWISAASIALLAVVVGLARARTRRLALER